MVKLKEIPRTATFAWSPDIKDPLLVTGTVAGAIDADFSSTTQLEFWDLSLLDRSSGNFQLSAKKAIDTDAR
jgi:protein transport protein SEC31